MTTVRASPRSWSDAGGASVLSRGARLGGGWAAGDRRRLHQRHAGLERLLRRRFGGFGELHRPGRLLGCVDLEEAGAVIAAREAIFGAADREFLVARAHESLSGPLAPAVVVYRIDVIESCHQGTAQQGFATARRQVPPAFGGPAVVLLVAERDADAARGVVAEAEVRGGGLRRHDEGAREQRASDGRARPAK